MTEIALTKTGPGSGRSISVLEDLGITPVPGVWEHVRIPIEVVGWEFGSRFGSLKFYFLGSGTLYLDSVSLVVAELASLAQGALLVAAGLLLSRARA